MKIRLLSLIVLFSLAFLCTTEAQRNYDNAIGLRLGYPLSATYKQFINETGAIEAYAGIRGYGFGSFVNVSGAYQVHNDIPSADGLVWYYGGGLSVYFWNYDNDFVFGDEDFSSTSLGIQGYLGLEYTFEDAPVSLSLDWVPTFFIGGTVNVDSFGYGYGSLAVRYVLGR